MPTPQNSSTSQFRLKERLRTSPGTELWECDCVVDGKRYLAKKLAHGATSLQREYFEREAIIASLLGGSAFLPPVSVVLSIPEPYLVYPYLTGVRTWGDADFEKLPSAVRLWMLRQVSQGIATLHAKGFVHGNIRPEHILVQDNFQVVIVGLGSSNTIGSRARLRRDGFDYDAPETREVFEACSSQDIYSLGVFARQVLGTEMESAAIAAALSLQADDRPSARELSSAFRGIELKLLGQSLGKAA